MDSILKAMIFSAVCPAFTATIAVAADAAQTAQQFPTKPLRFVVASTPGVGNDLLARMMGEKLLASWGQPVVVENRPGAGGLLAGSTVAKANPDGHTLLAVGGFAITAVMQPNLPYDPLQDFAGVTQIGHGTAVLIVAPAQGVTSVKELIALAHAQPGKLIYGSSQPGAGDQLTGARFIRATGIKVVSVAFKGSPEATVEVLAGRAAYAFVGFGAAFPFIQEGKLRALAVSKRIAVLPEVPGLEEVLPEFKRTATSWGLLAPAATPRPIVHKISKQIARVLDLPDIKARALTIGLVPATTTPEEYDKIIRDQIALLSVTVKELGIKAK